MSKDKRIFLAIPTHNGMVCGETMISAVNALRTSKYPIGFFYQKHSKLTMNFNLLLAKAINEGYSHFLMLHSDISVEGPWMQRMMEIMEERTAEILSVNMMLKHHDGFTSTGLCKEETSPLLIKRYTLKELANLPQTFTHPDIVLNTGVMLIDLNAPFMKHFGKGLHFRVTDNVVKEDGKLKVYGGGTEDWLFSLDARKFGATKLYATTEITAHHIGTSYYTNKGDWGIESEECQLM